MCIGDNDVKLSRGQTYGLLELNPSQAFPGLISLTWLVFCFEPLIVTVMPHYFCGQSRQVDFIISPALCVRERTAGMLGGLRTHYRLWVF